MQWFVPKCTKEGQTVNQAHDNGHPGALMCVESYDKKVPEHTVQQCNIQQCIGIGTMDEWQCDAVFWT